MPIPAVLDDRGAAARTDQSGSLPSVEHGLVRLEGAGETELHLQELRAADRV
jgi:hypothetical protein